MFTITNGNSMIPTIQSGSLAIVKKSSTYDVGDIAVYDSDVMNRTVIHRIIEQKDDGFIFQGDNNPVPDPGAITQDKIHGKVLFILPYFGYVQQFLKNPLIMATIVIASFMRSLGKKSKTKTPKKASQSLFLPAVLINIATYILVQISISDGIKPNMDGLTNYLFKILEPSFASTVVFAAWFFAIIVVRLAIRRYQAISAKKLEQSSRNSTYQIKEQNTIQVAGEIFYILFALIQIMGLIGLVKGLFQGG